MAVLFSAFSFFQDSLSRRPQRDPTQPTEKKAFPLPSPDITTPGVDSAWGADIIETCPDGQPSAIPARPGIVLLIRTMSTRVCQSPGRRFFFGRPSSHSDLAARIRSMMRHRHNLQSAMPRYIQIKNIAAESHVLLLGVTRAKQEMCSAKRGSVGLHVRLRRL
ncbi:hypothetical protein K456DRAFT_1758547 [Colletotrichum gloeosporioides 23]|nr:hypothetical protein K456DRAFT_1758547 [Colletotrichum gloeosporioides 23]